MFAVKTDRSAQLHIQYANSNVLNRELKYTYKRKEKKLSYYGKPTPKFSTGLSIIFPGKSQYFSDRLEFRMAGRAMPG